MGEILHIAISIPEFLKILTFNCELTSTNFIIPKGYYNFKLFQEKIGYSFSKLI